MLKPTNNGKRGMTPNLDPGFHRCPRCMDLIPIVDERRKDGVSSLSRKRTQKN
ncbi:hypothetical protein [Nonlabens agnitus]|uniref:hypothetical protein n=1 Tax=Nonlabens agnitus TaxID=870484 RepID=UPI001558BB23|nr:hypothetical protein [Nonlabens agnitus]